MNGTLNAFKFTTTYSYIYPILDEQNEKIYVLAGTDAYNIQMVGVFVYDANGTIQRISQTSIIHEGSVISNYLVVPREVNSGMVLCYYTQNGSYSYKRVALLDPNTGVLTSICGVDDYTMEPYTASSNDLSCALGYGNGANWSLKIVKNGLLVVDQGLGAIGNGAVISSNGAHLFFAIIDGVNLNIRCYTSNLSYTTIYNVTNNTGSTGSIPYSTMFSNSYRSDAYTSDNNIYYIFFIANTNKTGVGYITINVEKMTITINPMQTYSNYVTGTTNSPSKGIINLKDHFVLCRLHGYAYIVDWDHFTVAMFSFPAYGATATWQWYKIDAVITDTEIRTAGVKFLKSSLKFQLPNSENVQYREYIIT